MKKLKVLFLVMVSLFCLGSAVSAKAESIPGINLEMVSDLV